MKIQGLIVILLTAFVGVECKDWTDRPIEFPLELLKPDLSAFSQYYQKSLKNYFGFLQWPGSIIFRVRPVEHKFTKQDLLQVTGIFHQTIMSIFDTKYNAIYFKEETGKFFILKGELLKRIPSDTLVSYVQNDTLTTKPEFPYFSIRYFSLEELRKSIEPFYLQHMDYIKRVVKNHPATFLATPPNIGGHFVEYTFSNTDSHTTVADGKLRVLLGKVQNGHLHLKSNQKAPRLFFDKNYQNCTVPESVDTYSKPLRNVFGVRMAELGFMAEVLQSESKSLTLRDIDSISDPDANSKPQVFSETFYRDLLRKLKSVHPRYDLGWTEGTPQRVKFQMLGNIYTKSVNFKDGRFDRECPFTIEYAKKGRAFHYGNHIVQKLYANDSALWIEGEGPVPVPSETVILNF